MATSFRVAFGYTQVSTNKTLSRFFLSKKCIMLTNWATNGVSDLHTSKLVFMLLVLGTPRLWRRSRRFPVALSSLQCCSHPLVVVASTRLQDALKRCLRRLEVPSRAHDGQDNSKTLKTTQDRTRRVYEAAKRHPKGFLSL